MKVISTNKRKARKIHTCEFCYDKIEVREIYSNQACVYDDKIYHWKTHLKCNNISNVLNMYDYCDEGLDGDTFREIIQVEFDNIWRKKDNDHYESKDFVIPTFRDQLTFVIFNHSHKNKP